MIFFRVQLHSPTCLTSQPTLGMDPISGDIIVNSLYQPGDGYFEHVLAHEIGHALGLAHPFEGYYVDDAWTANDSLPTTHTVMTYNGIGYTE